MPAERPVYGQLFKFPPGFPIEDVSAVLRLSQDMKQALFPPKKRLR